MFYGAKKRRRMGRQHIHTCNIYVHMLYLSVCLANPWTLSPRHQPNKTCTSSKKKRNQRSPAKRKVKKAKKNMAKKAKKIHKFGLFIIKMAVCYLNSRYRCCCRPRLRCRCRYCCCRLALSFKENTHTQIYMHIFMCVCVWPRKLCCQNKNV